MDAISTLLVDYGVLGCWVLFSLIRERVLLMKIDEQAQRFELERNRWNGERTRWLRTLGRKLSDDTFCETQDD